MSRIIYISNYILSLVEYKPCDDRVLYDDWLDPETQRGYNGVYVTTFEDFQAQEVRQRFFAMIQLNDTSEIIGAVGISPPEVEADLAIWLFAPYRRKGYGTSAFALATKYAVEELKIDELHAGAYENNLASRRMLKKCGYIPDPVGTAENGVEKHYITGADIWQIDYIYNPISIRLAVPADALDMAKVGMRSWEVAYKDIMLEDYIREKNATRPAQYKRVITEDNTDSYVIKYIEKTVGIMKVSTAQDSDVNDSFYELHYIYLHPDYFRIGIGTVAAEFSFDKARNLGKKYMTVWVLENNINSIKFYEKCGFIADGKTATQNRGKPLTSIRMRKEL